MTHHVSQFAGVIELRASPPAQREFLGGLVPLFVLFVNQAKLKMLLALIVALIVSARQHVKWREKKYR